MASLIRVLKTIRNNWKKSIFATVLVGYGVNFAKDQYETQILMRLYCEEAQKYGDQPLPVGQKPRHITVILNPAAKNGKGKKLFEKYSAPLLHLAGIKVSLVKTEYEGQAKSLMEVMDNTDAVMIAGGDGTLLEAVTGLLRRPDADTVSQKIPIGVVPVGKTNTVAKMLFWEDHTSEVRWLAESTMAMIREVLTPIDVMHIKSDSGKPVFALGKLTFGIFRETEAKISKYWYWGPLKDKIAYMMNTLKKWPMHYEFELSYTPPCSGCSSCFAPVVRQPTDSYPGGKRWWHSFIKRKPTYEVRNSKDYSKIQNEECSKWQEKQMVVSEISINTRNTFPYGSASATPSLEVRIGSTELDKASFFKEGLYHFKEGRLSDTASETLHCKEIKLFPKVPEDSENWYSIDSEDYEVRPVEVKLHPRKIQMYSKSC